jgi:hypothetical protein
MEGLPRYHPVSRLHALSHAHTMRRPCNGGLPITLTLCTGRFVNRPYTVRRSARKGLSYRLEDAGLAPFPGSLGLMRKALLRHRVYN